MLQQLYDKCVKPSIRECRGQTHYGPSVAPNQLDETLRNINEHLGAIDAEQRIQNSEIQTLKCGNFQNVKISDTLKVDNIQSFSNACIKFLDPVNISDLTVENLHIQCFCADDAAKFAGLSCVEWKDIINESCVADSNMFAGKNCTEWKDIIATTLVNKAKDSDCFSGLTCTDWKNIIKTTCVDNADNSTKFDNKTYEQVCEDILSSIPPQPYSGEIDVYCGDACLCTINCENPLILCPNAFNENAQISTDQYPGAMCTGTLIQSDIQDFITMNDVDACGYTTCTGTVVQSDIADFITMSEVDACGYTTCVGTVTSVKACLNGTSSSSVTGSGTLSLNITPSLCFDSNSRKICNILGNKTSNTITLPSGINCVGTVVQSDIANFITMSEVDACGYTTCTGTVTSVNNITPVNGNVTLALPPDLSSDVTCLRNDVDAIESKIPTQASTTNQLADKDFVNSSIETATATFVGTFDDVSCLPTTGVDNNDYAFVTTCDSQTGTVSYTRYKYSDYTHTWICEYTINTTGFTAEQLAALNSGITDTLVAKITDVYNPTVCIYSNGTCCGSFTLNQSSNKCIGICNDKVSQTLLDTSANRPLLFASASITSGACCGVYYNTNITANSNTGVINATLNGLACRAKCNCVITTTCDCTYYPVFSPNNTSSYKYNYTNANLSYNPSTGTLTALCFNGAAKDSTCFGGCTYDCAKADIRDGLVTTTDLNSCGYTTCVGTVTSVNVCLNGTNATAITGSGKMCLNLTPSLSYTTSTRALTATLGNKTSTEITLPEGINCTGTLVPSDLNGYATEAWVNAKNYCTHDCLVKLSLLCSNADRRVLFSAQENGCICPVYASSGVPFVYNACYGCLKIGDFTCECCHQLTLRPNNGIIHSGPKGTQNNLGFVYLENNCLDNCSIGVGIGSGNVNRGFFDYRKASETATSPTFRWLQYWDTEKEIHALPIWGELGANNKVVYSCTGTVPNNTRRYALICFDKACCGNPSQISACFEIDIYTSKYNIWIDVANSVACMRTYWQTNGLDPNCTAYGSFCAALPDTTANNNCFWITYSNYRAPVIKSARKISIICNTTTAPSGITFTAPTNRNSYTNVYCGTTCKCTLQGPANLCLSANAFNEYASISETDYPGINKVGTLTSITINCNGTSLGTVTTSGTFNICDQNVCHGRLTSSATSADRNILLMGNGYTEGCCRPVWYSDACKITFNPRNGILKVGRVCASNYHLKYQQTLNLSSQSASCFYPVTWLSSYTFETDIEIQSPAGPASLEYNQNYIHFFERASGWNDMPKTLRVQTLSRYTASENVFGCIGYGTGSSQYSVIWLRGGRNYTVNANVALTANTTDVICGDTSNAPSTYTVGESLCGGTNTRVDVFANATLCAGTYSNNSTYGCFYNRNGCKYILECEVDARGYTTCTGTVTGVTLNGTAFTGTGSLTGTLTPSLSYANATRALTVTLGNQTSGAITLPEGINCVGTVTSVNACLNGTSATPITSSGTLALDITPSLSLSSDSLTVSLGNKTSSGIDLSSYVNDHKVAYTPNASSNKYPLIFSNATAPTSGSINTVGYSSGCVGYYQPNNGTLWTCIIRVGVPTGCTLSVAGVAGTIHGAGSSELYGATPYIDFHHNYASADYSARIINSLEGRLDILVNNSSGAGSSTYGTTFCFCSDGYLYGCVCGNLCGNASLFGGCTYAQACTDIRNGLCDHDCLVEYVCCCSTCKYPLLFAGNVSPTSGCCYGVGFSYGNYLSYFEPFTGTISVCCLKVGNPVVSTASQTGKSGTYYTDTGIKVYGMSSPSIEFHAGSSDCASMRLYQTKCALSLLVTDAYGCDACTTGKYFTFCANGYLYGCVCGNLQGTALSATNSTCFNGCTYTQAYNNIRSGLVTTTALNSCGYISSISLNGNAFTVSNGAATLTGFKPDTAVLADCATTIKRNTLKVSDGCPLALLGGITAIDNANIYVSCYCQATFNSCNGVLLSPILCATSYVRTPTINAALASGASKVCNVVIRACCTNAECTVTCNSFIFCGSTGRMHGNVCGNLYGNAYNSCLVCRYTINTGVQHVLLGANCTASANTSVRVSNGCPLTYDPETGVLAAKTFCGNVCSSSLNTVCVCTTCICASCCAYAKNLDVQCQIHTHSFYSDITHAGELHVETLDLLGNGVCSTELGPIVVFSFVGCNNPYIKQCELYNTIMHQGFLGYEWNLFNPIGIHGSASSICCSVYVDNIAAHVENDEISYISFRTINKENFRIYKNCNENITDCSGCPIENLKFSVII